MQFTLKTLLLLFVVVAAALGVGGVWGLIGTVWLACVILCTRLGFERKSRGWRLTAALLVVLPCILGPPILQHRLIRSGIRIVRCENQLKQLAIALYDYEEKHGSFPPAYTTDKDGRPMHSWRVLILPYIDEEALYKSFHLDEPWDSPHNKKVAARTPEFFCCPEHRNRPPGTTDYVAVTGPGTMWDGSRGCTLEEIADGPDTTLMLVETADSKIPWNAPRDLTLEEATAGNPASRKAITSYHDPRHPGIARPYGNVAFADTHIDTVRGPLGPKDFEALATIAGGRRIPPEFLERERQPWAANRLSPTQEFWARLIGGLLLAGSFLWLVTRPLPPPRLVRQE